MNRCAVAPMLTAIGIAIFSANANAAKLPPIRKTSENQVPACATPGRLMAFLNNRNAKLNPRYKDIASDYMRHGEELGVRWDYAFFQMLVETANLKYTGDVRAKQNNFAGLGATGNGERGESFAKVSLGVRAHLQHVLMYSGAYVKDPVADRTRKVQAWKILTPWQKKIGNPITFAHLTQKWSPGDRGYPQDIAAIGDLFFAKFCNIDDPNPGLVASTNDSKTVTTKPTQTAAAAVKVPPPPAAKPPAASKVKANSSQKNSAEPKQPEKKVAELTPNSKLKSDVKLGAGVKVLNPVKTTPPAAPPANSRKKTSTAETKSAGVVKQAGKTQDKNTKIAAAGAAAGAANSAALLPKTGTGADKTPSQSAKTPDAKPPVNNQAAKSNCRVWTASYGGSKAIIIKANKSGLTNYTVLDVNKGKEKREAAAYIAAYAKGGKTVGQFPSQTAALDKAFELCPEG